MFADKTSATIANPSLMHEPLFYSIIWLVVGLLFLVLFVAIIVMIFYLTRKKPIKTIANLTPKSPKAIDINSLRQKYLQLIDQTEQAYGMRKIKAAQAHQSFSIIVRLYYAEVCGFHAEVLTLRDLRHSKNTKLAKLIETYYPEEFSGVERGSVFESSKKARELIMDNEAVPKNISQTSQPIKRRSK